MQIAGQGSFDLGFIAMPLVFNQLPGGPVMATLAGIMWFGLLFVAGITSSVAMATPALSFVEENFDFYGRTLNGTPELRARWKRGVDFVEGAIGDVDAARLMTNIWVGAAAPLTASPTFAAPALTMAIATLSMGLPDHGRPYFFRPKSTETTFEPSSLGLTREAASRSEESFSASSCGSWWNM